MIQLVYHSDPSIVTEVSWEFAIRDQPIVYTTIFYFRGTKTKKYAFLG